MKTYKNSQTLRAHKRKKHNPNIKVQVCKDCDYTTKDSYHMKRHFNSQHRNLSVNIGIVKAADKTCFLTKNSYF